MGGQQAGMVIVGAGQAGGRAALALRELGQEGPVTLIGAEAAPPYERPPLSKAFLKGEVGESDIALATREGLAAAGIGLRTSSRALAIDRARREVVLDGGVAPVPYAKLLLATGRRVRRLPLAGPGAARVRYLRTVADARLLRGELGEGRRLVVIGGGLIGLEVAATAAGLGCRVAVVEQGPRLLGRAAPAPLAAMVEARHKAAGVEVHLGAAVEAVDEAEGGGLLVRLADGRSLAADAVLAGIGATPRDELARDAGLEVDGGIVVDATLATSDPDILAAGDVCAFPGDDGSPVRLEAWRNADAQGALAARNMLGAGEAYRDVPWFWSDQYELTLQVAGRPERGVRTVERAPDGGGRLLFHLDADGRLVGAASLGPPAAAKDAKLALMMVERGLSPDPVLLADPATRLRALLR